MKRPWYPCWQMHKLSSMAASVAGAVVEAVGGAGVAGKERWSRLRGGNGRRGHIRRSRDVCFDAQHLFLCEAEGQEEAQGDFCGQGKRCWEEEEEERKYLHRAEIFDEQEIRREDPHREV